MNDYTLYTYFRSSAAYRVRIALNLKDIPYDSSYVHLLNNGGEQKSNEYLKVNPQGMIPSLHINHVTETIHQSFAILEYLEETHPSPALLPRDPVDRAHVRAFALAICCDIHPLNNLRVLAYLKQNFDANEERTRSWYQHWINAGFSALETKLTHTPQQHRYCYGETASLADVCLIPQVYNALRFQCDMSNFPRIQNIYQHCLTMDAFHSAAPEQQPDFE